MRILITILMLPLLAYGGVKGYLWYDFKSKVDEAIAGVAPFVDIKYESVHTDLRGEVGLNKVVIQPKMAPDVIELAELRLKAPNILYFLDVSKRVNEGKMPELLGMSLTDLKLDLDSDLLRSMAQMQAQAEAASGVEPQTSMDALGCGDVRSFGVAELQQMGYSELVSNVEMQFEFDESDNTFTIDLNGNSDGLYSFEVNTQFQMDPNAMAGVAMGMVGPQVNRLRLDFNDHGYAKSRNAFCAAKGGGEVEAYVDRHIALLAEEMGANFSENAVKTYRNFMLKGGTLSIATYPAVGTDFTGLALYTPRQAIAMLGMEITINGTLITEEELGWLDEKTLEKHRVEAEEAARQKEIEAAVKKRKTVRTIGLAELTQYIDWRITLNMADGEIHKGRLEAYDGNNVIVRKRLHGGTISYPVVAADVVTIQVVN
ncbi:hypothetical protein BOW53_12885 [Solemya pervernicosa gill symbiont]|uniref:Uncharacterized protein n=2 Tax=Gammaproteobacteria incertae sedis TaxID=118884 RepID=A0A1T2L1V9_9GAMM|nr:hypothetical protein [Candidatus Reidiella endopervernicosa]OOZ39103.1 hypothetical protein BOW53_12885 [Solemya pervernicosa gill symbiont]QKQ26731.1 hypothetical protein HUE57_10880 [Candidatus Reidiella endopervernicosa]